MQIVDRESLNGTTSATVDGIVHDIGLLKDFHGHPALSEFVPEFGRLSMSWTRLLDGEQLDIHEHPTKSMIIVTEGKGQVMGDVSGPIVAGDVVIVPPGAKHGFIGSGPSGFWALSIQFEGAGLYERTDDPRVVFTSMASVESDVATIRAENDRYMHEFGQSALVRLVGEPSSMSTDVSGRVLGYLQGWSDMFQRVIAARSFYETDEASIRLASQHLAEEVGHNRLLTKTRGSYPALIDPVISAASSWFVDQMVTANSIERTVLAHLVLEGSGLVFHSAALASFPTSEYFNEHDSADVGHLEMGFEALAGRRDWTVTQVCDVLREGWQMIALLCDRIAERSVEK